MDRRSTDLGPGHGVTLDEDVVPAALTNPALLFRANYPSGITNALGSAVEVRNDSIRSLGFSTAGLPCVLVPSRILCKGPSFILVEAGN